MHASSTLADHGLYGMQFGPLFIHPAFYFGNKLIYRKDFEHSKMQK